MKNRRASVTLKAKYPQLGAFGFTVIGLSLFLSACGGGGGQRLMFLGSTQPVVQKISPPSGPTTGGTTVAILGENFQTSATVTFGGVMGTSVNVISSAELTVVTPMAQNPGTVDVVVSNSGGETGTLPNGFTYNAPPAITNISPTKGSIVGLTSVTITGSGFQQGATITFGTVQGTVTSLTSTMIVVTTPAHTAGIFDVTVTNPDMTTATLKAAFTFGLPPTVTMLSLSSGPATGGTTLTITGTEFQSGATVTFGGSPALNVTVVSATQIQITTPASPGGPNMSDTVDVAVTNPFGPFGATGTLPHSFTYMPITVTVINVNPNTGSAVGGYPATITGTSFEANATVLFGSAPCTSPVYTGIPTQITCNVPVGTPGSTVNVTVTNPDSSTGTLLAGFSYQGVSFTVTGVSPSSGPAAGGTAVTVTGTGFDPNSSAQVYFGGLGGTLASSIIVANSTTITCNTPAHAGGAVDVAVVQGTSNFDLANAYTYTAGAGLTISNISPNTGTTAGGTMVTIVGSGFQQGLTVTFGTVAGTGISVSTDGTSITVTTPAEAGGAVNVIVTNPPPGSQSVTSTNGFTFTNPPPTVTSISPTSGSTSGGTTVTITGTGFLDTPTAPTVTFGSAAPVTATFISSTQITAATPSSGPSTVNVTVTNPDGQSATLTAAFTYLLTNLEVVTTTLPDGNANVPYYATLLLGGGTPPYTWSITQGPLPTGLTLNAATGVISGIPAQNGVSSFSVTLTDSSVPILTATASLAISIETPPVAALPTTFLDTTFPDTTGYTQVHLAQGGNLQAAINNASCQTTGTIILLASGATFMNTGGYKLPYCATRPAQQWIIITTDPATLPGGTSLPAQGTRIDPSYSPILAKILTNQSGIELIQAADMASYYWFMGVEIGLTDSVTLNYGLVSIGNTKTENTASLLPTYIYVDRCYLHGNSTANVQRGFGMNGAYLAAVDSYFENFHFVGTDNQAIASWNGTGPFKIVNNFLEASGEVILWGGAAVTIPQLIPSDIEIRRNHFFKPLSWYAKDPSYGGIHWEVKNGLEFKDVQRVLVEGNVFENNWADAQAGVPIVFTPRNSNSGTNCTACTVADITFRYNIVQHATGGYNIAGEDGKQLQTLPSQRIIIHDNLNLDISTPEWGAASPLLEFDNGGAPPNPTILPPHDITFDHNTSFNASDGILASNYKILNLMPSVVFTNNIEPFNQYPIGGSGAGVGNAGLVAYFINPIVTNNLLDAPPGNFNPSTYPAGNFYPVDFSQQHVGFVDFTGGDFRLCTAALCNGFTSPFVGAGTDGEDLGADVSAINAVTFGVTP